ncbi:hypothetical protein [Xenorhabdus entomophaga]|uniref:hypothetical protein n=1 Tax=Xenorhabdus entomophaga TaxID=3136257 RepID=UPI0030F4328B
MNEKDAWSKLRWATRRRWANRAIDQMSQAIAGNQDSDMVYDFNKKPSDKCFPDLHSNMWTVTNDLRQSLGEFTDEELNFEKVFKSKEFYIVHASDKNLINKPDNLKRDLNIYSRLRLEEKGIPFSDNHTTITDMEDLGNNDYVFFSLEVGQTPKKIKSRFGNYFYRIRYSGGNLSLRYSSMTLFDQIDPVSHLSKFPAERKRLLDYLKITDNSKQHLRARRLRRGTSFFSGALNSINGLLNSIIRDIRLLENESDRKKLLSARSDDDINMIVNALYRPEVRVPRMIGFVEGDYEMITPEMLGR